LFYVILLMLSCGHRKSPTGGEKDTIHPEIMAISPDEFSDISDSDLEVVFSKPIERSTIITGVTVYPPILKKKFKWEGNILTIKIQEELEQDTNYFFTFSTKIKGERGNTLDQDYTFVFASGKLANDKISGHVIWEVETDKKPVAKCTLMAADSTFIQYQEFAGKTFEFDHLNRIDHILEAYADLNNNSKYDYGKEPYFYQINPAAEFSAVDLVLSLEDTLNPSVKSAKTIWNNLVNITFDEPISELSKVEIVSHDSLALPLSIREQYLAETQLTLLTEPMDTLQYIVSFYDVQDKKHNVSDSLFVIFDHSALLDSLPPKVLSIDPRNGQTVTEYQPEIHLEFSEIVMESGFAPLLKDAEKGTEIPLQILSGNSPKYKFIPDQKLENYSSYQLEIMAGDDLGNIMKEPYIIKFIVIVRQ